MLDRRGFLAGVFSAFAAPAIVRAGSLMPIKAMVLEFPIIGPYTDFTGPYPNYMELVDITRKASIPRLFVQMDPGNYVLTEGL